MVEEVFPHGKGGMTMAHPVYHPSELRENPRRNILTEVMAEHIPMPGFPQIIVTRGFAHQYLKRMGWDESKHGMGEMDYTVFQTRATSEPLTDTEERDQYLNDPSVSEGYERNPKGGGYSGISGLSLKEAKSLGSRYAQLDQRSGRPQDAEKAWRLSSSSDFVSYFMPVWDLHRKKQEFVEAYDAGWATSGLVGNPNEGVYRRIQPGEAPGTAAFDAGKWWGDYHHHEESGVSSGNVRRYGFHRWYSQQDRGVLKGTRKSSLERDFNEGYRAGKGVGRKGNPETEASSRYEDFHGVPSDEILEFEESTHYHENLAALGELTELKVELPKNKEAVLDFDGCKVFLACNEEGTQMEFVGGDQELDIDKLGFKGHMADKEHILIGPVRELSYTTRKKFDKLDLVSYFHHLGEETGELPSLVYNPLDKSMTLVGGAYRILDVGITN